MARWTCPRCDREFERARQSHTCVPGCTVDTTFAGRAPVMRAIYDAIVTHLATLGTVHEDAVSVGVFLKRERKLAEVRPRSKDVRLYLFLPYPIDDERVGKVWGRTGTRVMHQIDLRSESDVDDLLCEWLTMAYDFASA